MSMPHWLLATSALLALAVAVGLLARRIKLQITVVLVIVGFLAGWIGDSLGFERPLEGEGFEEVVVFLFLPILVFEAALGLSVRAFFRNLGPILVLAIVAVVVSAALVGGALTLALGIPLVAALLFGALISATDPVAVVAIFRELGVPERLLTLVEGESMLNDGVAIVLSTILLSAALGAEATVGGGVVDFLQVFFGGVVIGAVLGLAVAALLPWLDRLLAASLTIALAYGGFVLADDVLGFSGVMAAVAGGLTVAGFAPSRASAETRETMEELWEAVGFIANALLFLLIGLAIEPGLIAENAEAIALAIVVVLVARAAAVLPLVTALERFAGISPVGRRNEAVLIWGGLRGGVALAIALALPESLPERETFVAMTGGVVLATLLLNATTVGALVHRLGLDQASRSDRFLAAAARLRGVEAARAELDGLGVEDAGVANRLEAVGRAARAELEAVELGDREQLEVVMRQGLSVERQTYQRLSDIGMLPAPAARTLLHEVDGEIEEINSHPQSLEDLRRREPGTFERLGERVAAALPEPAGEEPEEMAYAEAMSRRVGARRAGEAVALFEELPNIEPNTVAAARESFARWEHEAEEALAHLDAAGDGDRGELHERIADALGRLAARDALEELSRVGLLPESVARGAAEAIGERTGTRDGRESDGREEARSRS